jgi:inhibitor of growth protein 3
MPLTAEQAPADAASVLDDFTNRTANLPNEIAFMQEEIEHKDRLMQECLNLMSKNDGQIQKWIRINGSGVPNPKEDVLQKAYREAHDRAQILQEEKIALTTKSELLFEKHCKNLDLMIKGLQDRGEFPNDPDLPSLLRPQQPERVARVEPVVPVMPLNPINNSATVVHTRHPNQYPQRPIPAHVQAQVGVPASVTPTTPAAASLQSRQARESSQGAANKRQRLTGGLGVLPPSGLARQSSATPGTPRGGATGTPVSAARAGSAGPRVSQKSIKKTAPHGSRQSGAARKSLKKSGLSRVKRTGTKNSPSSTNDSELSDAESGSVEEEDEAVTPPAIKGDISEEIGDMEDDDGADDKKYCSCQSVSYGDMVACDNESCPYEWFHWTCVGLKSEPVGNWICPECSKNTKK